MSDYNSGVLYNERPQDGGSFYNGVYYDMFVRVRDIIESDETLKVELAKYILSDNITAVYDSIIQTAIYQEADKFEVDDESKLIILFKMAEEFGFKDELLDLTVLAFLHEKQDIIDQIKLMSSFISMDEEFNFWGTRTRDASGMGEKLDLFALTKLAEQCGMKDLEMFLKIIFNLHENMEMTDSEPAPKLATLDWLIGVSGNHDNAYDWFLPFELKVNWGSSDIQVLPQAELTTVESPGVDGSLVADTVYKDRLFQIVGFSEQGLTIQEKETLKRKIANLLATTKNESKKLAIQSRGISFDVRYMGQADIKESASWIKATIPLYASVYGYSTFEESVVGSGLIKNDGSVETGVRHVIKGPVTNPSFVMGAKTYYWSGTVSTGYTLTIDHEMKSVWLTDPNGKKTNQLAKFSGDFQKIPPETSVVITVPSSIRSKIETLWRNNLLW